MALFMGQEFNSYSKFEEVLSAFEKTVFANYVTESSTVLNESDLITPQIKNTFKYKRVYMICKFGGKRPEKEDYIRNNTRTYKRQCESKLVITLKKKQTGYVLRITSLNIEHNHELREDLFRALPKQRRDVIKKAAPLLSKVMKTKPDYKLLQYALSNENEEKQLVKRRDLYNYSQKLKPNIIQSDLDKVVNELLSVDGACVKIAHDAENVVCGIYFQDRRMKLTFDTYPEMLLFDATYKLNDRRMPLVILLAINGNGESQIVGLFIVKSENAAIFEFMFREFKAENENWEKVEVILTDKAMVNLSIADNEFPNAAHQICVFHTKQIFQREITTAKRQITKQQV